MKMHRSAHHALHVKVAEAIERGAAGFVLKPLKPASVPGRIDSCFKEKA